MRLSSVILVIVSFLMQTMALDAGASVIARTQNEAVGLPIVGEAAGNQQEVVLSPFFLLDVVTHDIHSAVLVGSRFAILHNGLILITGTLDDLKNSRDAEVNKYLTELLSASRNNKL